MAIQENPYLPPAARVADALSVEGDFIDGGRAVDASRGSSWIGEGWQTFRADAGTWLLISVVMFVIAIASSVVPFVGGLGLQLVMPVFLGGLMLACHKRRQGSAPGLSDLFGAFQTHVGPLILVGAISVGLSIVAVIPAALIVWATYGSFGFGIAVLLAVLVTLALLMPVYMAVWFASPLVVFQSMPPTQALLQSFRGCLKNIVPFLIYGLILLVLCVLATLPLFLGWLVLGPVIAASVYAAYRDIFFKH